jgi:hypothetical protein
LPKLPDVRFNEGKTFVDKHAPKPPTLFAEDVEAPPPAKRVPDVWERYIGNDLRGILQDVETRPEHYSSDHKETLEHLREGRETTSRARSDLLLTYMRRSEAQKQERAVRQRKTAEEIDDGDELPAFEDQHLFKGEIQWQGSRRSSSSDGA